MTTMKAEMTLDGFTPMFDELTAKYGVMTSAVFGTIWRYCQMRRKCCDAALDTIGKRIGVNKRTIIRHLEILVKEGYLIDTTPDLKHKPHTYIDAERVGFEGSLRGVTKSHPSEIPDEKGVTESHAGGDRESPPGVTESHLKKQEEETMKETEKDHEVKLPPAHSESTKKKTVLPDTLECRILFGRLGVEYKAQGRRAPMKFPSLACKEKYLKAADRLNGTLELAIDTGLEQGLTSVVRLVNYVSSKKWQDQSGGSNGHSANQRQTSIPGLRNENSDTEKRANIATGETYYVSRATGKRVPAPA